MRLAKLDNGHTFGQKALFAVIRLLSGHRAPDVIKTVLYRREFWGKQMSPLLQETMRGESEWSIGDRELMAAFVSKTNECEF